MVNKLKYGARDNFFATEKKTTKPKIKDYEKIISIQERIIKAKEKEIQMVEKLFEHYLDQYETYSWWYSKYKLYYDAIVKVIKSTSDGRLVYELKKQITNGDMSYWRSDD